MKKLVLFDLDGTLIDTLEDLSEAVNHALALRGLPLHTLDEYRGMVGHGVRSLVAQALEASWKEIPDQARDEEEALVDAALADFKEYYQAHIDVHTRPYPGIPELLADLQAHGVQLAVVSNKFQEGTEYLIKRLFPDIDFVAILGNRPGWPLKPSPEIVEDVLSRAGVSPEDALLVGDSPTDMRTAANGGIDALAVTWGYRTAEELEPVLRELFPDGPAHLVHSVPALRIELLGFYVSEPLSTAPTAFDTPLQQLIYETFASAGITFTRVDTDPGITMEDCAHISARIGVNIVKTIFLCNRQQTEFYLYVTSHDKPFVTREFCGALGIPRVSFASAEHLWELTGVHVGATTILSAVWPSCAGVHLVMDASIAKADWFSCTDGTPTCFVKLRTRDLLDKYLTGREVSLI
ncbi:MAG: HAD-IA family hydrolase [Bacteroidales bacterium]|nr:HAD-IA family hydrolase [Bacteroidales bacterium]